MTLHQSINKQHRLPLLKERPYFIGAPGSRYLNNLLAYVKKRLEDGYKLAVWVYQDIPEKSEAQRNWFHYLCGILGNEIGYTKEEMKMVIKQECYGYYEVEINGKLYTIIPSSERDENGRPRNKIEYGDLIDKAYEVGSNVNVTLPDPAPRLRSRS